MNWQQYFKYKSLQILSRNAKISLMLLPLTRVFAFFHSLFLMARFFLDRWVKKNNYIIYTHLYKLYILSVNMISFSSNLPEDRKHLDPGVF